jgi:hypothetical protein
MVETFAHTNYAGTSVIGVQQPEPPFWELEKLIEDGHSLDRALQIMIARSGGCHKSTAARLHLTAWAPRSVRPPEPGYWQNLVEAERRA